MYEFEIFDLLSQPNSTNYHGRYESLPVTPSSCYRLPHQLLGRTRNQLTGTGTVTVGPTHHMENPQIPKIWWTFL
jgi:hypothetical protein